MEIGRLLAMVYLFAALAMAVAFVGARRAGKIGYVDVAWAGLMALSAALVAALASGTTQSRLLVAVFGGAWAWRLFGHLLRRVSTEPEDGRYVALRARFGDAALPFFVFFQMQALVVALFCLPFAVVATRAVDPRPWQVYAAAIMWLASVGGEALADRQLARFRADPAHRRRTCRAGLWAWSRHPNYFFEWLHWFTYPLLAYGHPQWWLALCGPVLMLLFLYRLSGIPWTEAQSLRSRGDDYRRYQAEVSPFLPMPPRRGRTESNACP
jgi:steroid 5-alpha reductase family enzyme